MVIISDKGHLYYDVIGEGRPLVFISGWAMSSECWRPAVEALASNHRCVIYDPRGVARSQPNGAQTTFTIEDHAEDLHIILREENIFDAIFIAHEMGALVAQVCAEQHPQEVSSFVLVSPRANFSKDTIKSLSVFTPASLMLRDIASFPIVRNLIAFRYHHAPQPYRDRLFDDFAELSPRAAYETALSASEYYENSPIENLARHLTSPLLLICGDEDKKGVTQARQLFSLARGAKLATLKDCGFLPMLEYPRQFARLIETFAESTMGSKLARRLDGAQADS